FDAGNSHGDGGANPRPAQRGEGAERRRREAGEGHLRARDSPSPGSHLRCSPPSPPFGGRGSRSASPELRQAGTDGLAGCICASITAHRSRRDSEAGMAALRLATYRANGRVSYGAVTDGGIIDLAKKLSKYPTLLDVFRAGAVNEARAAATGAADHQLKDVELVPPIPAPEKIICVAINYPDRPAEHQDSR